MAVGSARTLWPSRLLRSWLQRLTLLPVVRWFCSPLVVINAPATKGPFVFIANHSSHADTAVIIKALPARLRRRLAPAAAEDYFFRGRVRSWMVRAFTGAFPFPRSGDSGLDRAMTQIERGRSVLLFPEGTRGDGTEVAQFRCGIGELAARGATIVPIGLYGTHDVLPKGRSRPKRASVVVFFGTPMRFIEGAPARPIADRLHRCVEDLAAKAALVAGRPFATVFQRLRSFLSSPIALYIAFAWAVAEALVWPVVPDVYIAGAALAVPARALLFALCAVAGSVVGGAIAWVLAAVGLGAAVLSAAPLVTEKMTGTAAFMMQVLGPFAILYQPFSGIPYKTFALQSQGSDLFAFLGHTVVSRGGRFFGVALLFAAFGYLTKRWMARLYFPLIAAMIIIFTIALSKVVTAWS